MFLVDLSGGHVVFQRVQRQAQDVVIVAQIKPLTVFDSVINHTNSRHVVHHLTALTVGQVIPAVEASVPAPERKGLICLDQL